MKRQLFILILLIFLIFTKTHNTPFWTQENTSIPSGSQYSPSKNYGFQINWTDSVQGVGGISSVVLETDFYGTRQNFTKSTTPAVQNNTNGVYWINFTDLKPGDYSYKWYANDTNNNFNSTNDFSYPIEKNNTPIVLKLDGTEGNKSYNLNNIAKFNVSLSIPGKTVYLNSSYPGWSLQFGTSFLYNETNLTQKGTFSATAYYNEDENYTGSSVTYYFDNTPPQFSGKSVSPSPFPYYEPNKTYQFNITWSDATLNHVWFESNHTGTRKNYTYPTVQNQSGVFWINLEDLKGGTFNYRWIANDNINNVNNTTTEDYVVHKAYSLTMVSPTVDIVIGNSFTVSCYSNTLQITYNEFKLYRDNTLVTNTSIVTRGETVELEIGSYNYVCNTTGNRNFTNQSLVKTINVVASQPSNGGQPPPEEFKISDISSPSIEIGKAGQGTFNLSNTFSETLVNIDVDVTGIPAIWYTVEGVPSALLEGGNTIIKIKFDIPDDAETKEYELTIKVTADVEDEDETKTVSQKMILKVTAPSPYENEPPSYYTGDYNTTAAGEPTLFSLDWVDDTGLSSFIFSTNISGNWLNDSESSLSGRNDTTSAVKTLNSEVGKIIAWKFYISDVDDAWVASEEFYLVTTAKEGEIDIVTIVIVIFVIIITLVAFFFLRSKFSKIEEEIIYYYSKDGKI
jgi:hypothetical protein